MGIGDTVKSMIGQGHEENAAGELGRTPSRRSAMFSKTGDPGTFDPKTSSTTTDTDARGDSSRLSTANRGSHKLPSGTGIGTSGKGVPAHQTAMESDLARESAQGIAGYGTDAAAASGGSMAGTHSGARTSGLGGTRESRTSRDIGQEIKVGPTSATSPGSLEGQPMGGSRVRHDSTEAYVDTHQSNIASTRSKHFGHTGVLDSRHDAGHTKRDVMPSGDAVEQTQQLHPVTHEHIRHLETEDIERLMEHERHVHHVQHHTQPITASGRLPDKHRENIHPITRIEEQHANKAQDNTLFEGQVRQHHDSIEHLAKERTIIDKGTTVTENVHHHIHHVIQPVIEKNVIDQEYTHTKIPIHEITHEAPIVHQSQTHAPIPMEQFVERGGLAHGGISQDEIASKVLRTGECSREVDGVASDLEASLHLDSQEVRRRESPEYITTKVTKRTTVVDEPVATAPTARN